MQDPRLHVGLMNRREPMKISSTRCIDPSEIVRGKAKPDGNYNPSNDIFIEFSRNAGTDKPAGNTSHEHWTTVVPVDSTINHKKQN